MNEHTKEPVQQTLIKLARQRDTAWHASSETDIENEDGYFYFAAPPPKWLEVLALVAGVVALLLLGTAAMVGAAFLLVLHGYGA